LQQTQRKQYDNTKRGKKYYRKPAKSGF
jgi:hypothetical protein